MIEMTLNGERKLVFVVNDGEAAMVVLPIEKLSKVDLKRIYAMDQKQEKLLDVMRETVLDNGANALGMYNGLFEVVPKEKPKKEEVPVQTLTEGEGEVPEKPKRRGRPPKAKEAE